MNEYYLIGSFIAGSIFGMAVVLTAIKILICDVLPESKVAREFSES